ncbi:chromosome segregation protein SMC [Suicoccus acidiformans]|uniref:Chromosome partition protein Smc n=1 Tax=Suicoccus acidiformans TaxID=2036206 RepID=A0A347WJZ7_9LACT|nr:chromosome segregation protein SMC [Suicoccus acidiformans]AXY25404.1 chromosome segregation protein SMC [Suicoccus acidiformans]
MYLSRIEMTGFKSFADKTVIEFDQGMTAVVGPNGSGKSNLSEAIRWVLGEQSAKSLRGSRMEDVIFNGTQDRKAVNIARVTLVLNNEDRYLDMDFSEVSLTRTYHRNGESKYYINNEAVRLKDIVNLLLDTGLGKDSFSIISQGQVEQIFLNKPEERRTIFEEAAGVQKYQYRKTEAERKLEKSKDHLSRVKDILHELSGQLEPLEVQRNNALTYQELKAGLKEAEVSLYTYQIQTQQVQWQAAERDLESKNEQFETLEKQYQEVHERLAERKIEQENLIQAIDASADRYQGMMQALERKMGQAQMLDQQITFQTDSFTKDSASHEETLTALAQEEDHLSNLKAEYQATKKDLLALKVSIQDLEKQMQRLTGKREDQVEALRQDMIDLYQKQATASNQLKQSEDLVERLSERQIRLAEALEAGKVVAETSEAEATKAQDYFQAQDTAYQTYHKTYQAVLLSQQANQEEREQAQQALFQKERQVQQLQGQVDSQRQQQASYAGYYQGVRSVMTAQHLQGIEGTVADLIQVEASYQQAIDTALGGALQHIIVQDDQAARAAIEYLRKQRAGRATFLPRPNIKSRSLADHLHQAAQKHPGFVGVASDLVQSSPENRAIVENLLGTTVVVEEVSQAQLMAKDLKQSVKLVTLDGEVIMPGGAITGGRNKHQQSSMLTRQRQLEEVEAAYKQANDELAQLERNWQAIQSQEKELQKELTEVTEHLNKASQARQQAQHAQEAAKQEARQASERLIIQSDEQKTVQQELTAATELVISSQADLQEAQAAIEANQATLEQLTASEADRQAQVSELEQQLHRFNTQEAVQSVELKQLQQAVLERQEKVANYQAQIESYQHSRESQTLDIDTLKVNLAKLQTENDLAKIEAEQLETQIEEQRQERTILTEAIRLDEGQEKTLQDELQQLGRQIARLEGQIEKYTSFIDRQLDYLNSEYQLNFEMAQAIAQPIENETTSENRVKTLRRKIDQLGPINLQAIEDYDELKERFDNLSAQEADLLTAMGQLEATMAEMDEEVTSRFGKTFHEINEQFQGTFQKLFAGGSAYLELTQPDNLLTTGVDIIAQPPGKRKQNLALLSGGERALTAIALLFAILEVKPVPFVVLDEVEAALDDANVYRYGEYIQSFTEDTQFIVITHRKGTMEHADVLYGVTMEKSGVSKLASVRLSEAEEALEA